MTRIARMMCRVLSVIVVTSAVSSVSLADQPIQIPAGERQLFLDDYLVASTSGLEKTMHQPDKRGAVIWPDQPWEMSLGARCAPAWDENEKVYKLWMITSTPIIGPPDVGGTTYAESKDGIHWTKPILRQYKYQGSLENNFINVGPEQLEWPENAIENVVYDPDDPDPSRRYKGFLGALSRRPIVSPDDIHWTRLDVPKIPSSDESNLSYGRLTKTFIATLKTGNRHGRAHGIWTSKDFETWTNTNVVFGADDEDQRLAKLNIAARLADPTLQQTLHNDPADYNADINNLGLFRYEGVYVGMPQMLHMTSEINEQNSFSSTQLACSRDLQTWQRLGNRQPFIGYSTISEARSGQGGAYDLMHLLPPSALVVRGDELWFYYSGFRYPMKTEEFPSCAVHLGSVKKLLSHVGGWLDSSIWAAGHRIRFSSCA